MYLWKSGAWAGELVGVEVAEAGLANLDNNPPAAGSGNLQYNPKTGRP